MADGYARASGGLGRLRGDFGSRSNQPDHGCRRRVRRFRSGRRADRARWPPSRSAEGPLQESSTEGVDIVDVFKQVTRYSTLVFRADRLPATWHKALRMALGGRPGPVHLSLPADVQEQSGSRSRREAAPAIHRTRTYDRAAIKAGGPASPPRPAAGDPRRTRGHPVGSAPNEIRALAEMLQIPVATTPKGKGVFPEDHRLALGPFGYSGSPLAQWYLLESGVDVLLAVGTSLGEWGTHGVGSSPSAERGSAADRHRPVRGRQELQRYRAPDRGCQVRAHRALLRDPAGSSSATCTGGAATASSSRHRTARDS